MKLSGRANVHWKDSTGKSGRMVYYRSEEVYFDEELELYGQGDVIVSFICHLVLVMHNYCIHEKLLLRS